MLFRCSVCWLAIGELNVLATNSSQTIPKIDEISNISDNMYSYVTQDFSSCKYYNANTITTRSVSPKDLLILHINIRSLNKNMDDLLDLLNEIRTRPSIICLTETRLKHDSLVNIEIQGYKFFHADSVSNAGGVGMYVSEDFQFSCENSFGFSNNGCENMWININTKLAQNFLVGVVYRHPNANIKDFIDHFNDTLQKINEKNINCVILGDFNINILQHRNESAASYINMLNSNGFFSLLNKPTRITDSSASLIDHVITNNIKCHVTPGIMNYQITDHLPTFIALKNIKKPSSNSVKFYRCMKQFDSTKFCQDLQISLENFVNDMPELNLLNFNGAFQLFLNTLHIEINAHAPIKRCTRRQKRLQCKPWISKGLYVSIRNKQKLYKSHYLKGSINEKKF